MKITARSFVVTLFCLLTAASMCLIFYNSSLNADDSTDLSRKITDILLNLFDEKEPTVPSDDITSPSVGVGAFDPKPDESVGNKENPVTGSDAPTPPTVPDEDPQDANTQSEEKKQYSSEVIQKNSTVRRAAHAIEFIPLGFSMFGLAVCLLRHKQRALLAALYSLLGCILYAVFDEVHQIFVDGRACEFSDGLMDTLGSLIGIVLCLVGFTLLQALRRKAVRRRA